jgi:AcrR family transcriptional regulator
MDTRIAKPVVENLSILQPINREQWIKRNPITGLGQRIVSATVNEFAEKGILGARIAEITRLAGTTDPAFYRYFASIKNAALFIMSEYYWAPLNLRLSHYQQVSNDSLQLFEAVVQALIQSTADDPSRPWLAESKVFRIVVAQMRNPALLPDTVLDTEYLAFIDKLEKIIHLGQQQKIFSSVLRPYLVAQILVVSLHSLLMQNCLNLPHLMVKEKEVIEVAHQLVGLCH